MPYVLSDKDRWIKVGGATYNSIKSPEGFRFGKQSSRKPAPKLKC